MGFGIVARARYLTGLPAALQSASRWQDVEGKSVGGEAIGFERLYPTDSGHSLDPTQ